MIKGIKKLNADQTEYFRGLITNRLSILDDEDTLGEAGQATVELDQQAVGRLSRQDALQNQAMAKATHARREAERQKLKAALARMDEGEFGYCEDCGDAIATRRLELDPGVTRCVECAKG